jgi:hypothetical protein
MFEYKENKLFYNSELKQYLEQHYDKSYFVISSYMYLLNKNDGISLYLNDYAI